MAYNQSGTERLTLVLIALITVAVIAALLIAFLWPRDSGGDFFPGPGRVDTYRLTSLIDPQDDIYVAPRQGIYFNLGRAERIEDCGPSAAFCITAPFLFSAPNTRRAPLDPWSAGDYQFRVIEETRRRFCGREREVWLIEGGDGGRFVSRVWYHPNFGVFAVAEGEGELGEFYAADRVFVTCRRGLFRPGRGDFQTRFDPGYGGEFRY